MRAAKTLVCLHICADLPEPLLLADALSTEILCAGLYVVGIQSLKKISNICFHGKISIL